MLIHTLIVGDPYTKKYFSRYSLWKQNSNVGTESAIICDGQWVRGICIFGPGDLSKLYDRPEMFANKFFTEQDEVAFDCMEEMVLNRTLDELPDLKTLRRLIDIFSNQRTHTFSG